MKKKLIIISIAIFALSGIVYNIARQPTLLKQPTEAALIRPPHLEQVIMSKIGKSGGTLHLSDVITLTSLNLSGENLSDITGLGNIHNLEQLDLSNNNISDLGPLTSLRKLVKLDLSSNDISNLEIIVSAYWPESGATINLKNNPLDNKTINTYIPELLNRGVNVEW